MIRLRLLAPASALALLLPILACSGAAAPAPTELRVTVMSFNIRWGGFDDGENSWANRKDLAAEVVRRADPDVVGIQEASPPQIRDLLAALPRFRAYDAGDRSDVVPILYRDDRFRLDKSGGLWLVEESDLDGGTRRCTWVRLVERSTGLAFRHLNLHLDHRSLPSRKRSAIVLARHLARLDPPDPFVVTGDFNTAEDGPPLRFLRGEIALAGEDGREVRNPVPLVDTFRKLHPGEELVNTGHGFRGGPRGRKIDYVLVPAGTKVVTAEIRRDHRGPRYPSDHFPVTARVVLPAEWSPPPPAPAPIGRFFLVRRRVPPGLDCAYSAVMLTKETDRGEGGCRYVWYSPSEATGDFAGEAGDSGEGEVFERYRREEEPDGTTRLVNDGGRLHIRCGIGRVEWSKHSWIYFDSRDGPVEIALTDATSIEDVSLRDPKLEWKKRKRLDPGAKRED